MAARPLLFLVPLLILLAAPAAADDSRIDPFLRFAPPPVPFVPTVVEGQPASALLVAPGLDDEGRRALEARGLVFRRTTRGSWAQVGDVWSVEGTPDLLLRLAREGWEVQLARPLQFLDPPTAYTGPEIEVKALIASGPTPVEGLTGEGVRVLDLDSGLDPFHPHFFAADGGAFDWVDVNGDGELDPGDDGIDLDGDGAIDDQEELHLLEGWRVDYDDSWQGQLIGIDDELDVGVDFVFLDADGDGERDFGAYHGFTEDDPAYGEWLFVPDDADNDGAFEPGERLLLLDSSRFRAISVGGVEYERDEDLVEYPRDSGFMLGHGTGVLGIVAGGRPGLSRYPGLLPEVDLLGWVPADDSEVVEALAWADDLGADVVIHEYAVWYSHHLDGSEGGEQAVDAAGEDGIVQVCPTGNLATAGKHASKLPTDDSVEFGFHVPASVGDAQYFFVSVELHMVSSGGPPTCELTDPDGAVHVPALGGGDGVIGPGLSMWSADYVSGRGNRLVSVYLLGDDWEETLPPGDWSLRCDAEVYATVHAFTNDAVSGWGRGITLDDEDDATTMGFPSTSDECIAVGAYVGREVTYDNQEHGELHDYSSQGPRLEPGKTLDVAAPADAWTPLPLEDEVGHVGYRMFGGTSGAAPHVAAVAAQLKQAEPDATGQEIREMLQQGALVDGDFDGDLALPDDRWGYGKVRGYQGLFGEEPPDPPSTPVEVVVEFESELSGDDCRVTAIPAARDHPDATFRWDWAYDGRWDGGFDRGDLTYVIEPGEDLTVRVQAAMDGWWLGDGLGTWTVPDTCVEGNSCQGCASGCRAGGGSSGAGLGLLLVLVWARRRR